MSTDTEEPYYYCGATLLEIGRYYNCHLYTYITVITCSIGVILNLLNLLVFTRKTMNSPPNLIFTHLALVDLQQLLMRLLSAWLKRAFDKHSEVRDTFAWLTYRRTNSACSAALHFVSVFLTVQLAIWRYLGIVHPVQGRTRDWCNMRITRNAIIAGYIICSISLGLPTFLSREIKTRNENSTKFRIGNNPFWSEISFVVYGVMDRLIPSVLLAFLTYRLAVTLLARETKAPSSFSGNIRNDVRNDKRVRQASTSTTTLFVVVALFIIAEFPKGILSLLQMIYLELSDQKLEGCYYSLIKIFHSITNFNTSITFAVYYTLSEQFRNTFKSLFRKTTDQRKHTSSLLPIGNMMSTPRITSNTSTCID